MDSGRKKLLWLSHLLPYPPKGGVLQRSYNLLKEVSKQHEVYMVAFNQKNLLQSSFIDECQPLDAALEALKQFCEEIRVVDIPSQNSAHGKHVLAVRSLFAKHGYTVEWLNSDIYRKTIKNIKEQNHFAAVFYDTISLSLYRDELEDIPSILNHHNVESEMMHLRAQKERNPLKKIYFAQEAAKIRKFEKKACQEHEINIVCSDEDGEILSSICGPLTIETVPNGVDIDYFRPRGLAPKKDSLVFAGGLSWYPNLDAMRWFKDAIWPLIGAAKPTAKMTLIGKNPPRDLVRPSNPQFEALGFVDDVRPYLEEASCYVCPIRDGGGTKLKILDALAMQCAIVAHPFACVGIDVKDGQEVLLAETPEAFAEKVLEVLEDRSLQERLGRKGRELVESQYSFSKIGAKLSGLIRSLYQRGENSSGSLEVERHAKAAYRDLL